MTYAIDGLVLEQGLKIVDELVIPGGMHGVGWKPPILLTVNPQGLPPLAG
jgi:hypothetical protein